ncbi:hypothetical protein HOP50_05g36100 [Chloropicon primus]|uniref:Transferrin-binding protein B C-lobe/N-lobe beta barrel domain-containing protein n=1 Tax=Chloropicon primus TaxID=1764295 RepID=A0A5B8MM29_9CHLO|nr:hypothetical protein A3770_05p36020 [Chloropicon primus]UPR00296.1 hypothetical protein HOP50_05g36100 [Chloropicon primus]|eukprot:QDZ21084.1 hypothetical protein A3770_05p36020 [Chloropicon primus]
MNSNNNNNNMSKKAMYLALAALAVSSAACSNSFYNEGTGIPPSRQFARATGGSHVSSKGPNAHVSSGNAAIAYREKDKTDWSLAKSATYVSSGLYGEANGNSGTYADTGKGDDISTHGESATDAHMSNFHYEPHSTANSYFDGSGSSLERPLDVAAGNDVALATPLFAGASAGIGAGVALTEPALFGTQDALRAFGGGVLPLAAVDVAFPGHGRRLLDVGEEEETRSRRFASATGGSHIEAKGPHAEITSANGAIGFRQRGGNGTDWSLTKSATWASSGLFGKASGNSGTQARTGVRQSSPKQTFAESATEGHMTNLHYEPVGTANSYFDGATISESRPFRVAAGNDVALSTPTFVGASAGIGAGRSSKEPALFGVQDALRGLGGGALPLTAVDIAFPGPGK